MNTKDKFYNVSIISAFPGMGKSYCAKQMMKKGIIDVIDMESSDYHWIQDTPKSEKTLDPRWPNNYIESIITKAAMLSTGVSGAKGGIIFVSSHNEVIEGLKNIFTSIHHIFDTNADSVFASAYFLYNEKYISFSVVVPSKDRRAEFAEYYLKRGNTKEFIDKLYDSWDKFIDDAMGHDVTFYTLHKGHIGDYFAPLVCNKFGDKEGHNVIITMGANTYDEVSFMEEINRSLYYSIHTYTLTNTIHESICKFKLMIKHRNRVSDRARYMYIVELVDKEGAGEFIDMINDDENYSAIYKNCNFTYI